MGVIGLVFILAFCYGQGTSALFTMAAERICPIGYSDCSGCS
ncbi:secreted protein [Rhodopirellula europaea 6C]|uniref:Secreted protein n=1 Tax=Rhodopirellula europaea 6C TaxID=1263867 RepID=M2B1U2_9BACT|nr:secreted protein [Rhodopirellula europaea 6C]